MTQYHYSYAIKVGDVTFSTLDVAPGEDWVPVRDQVITQAKRYAHQWGSSVPVSIVMSKSHVMWSNQKRAK